MAAKATTTSYTMQTFKKNESPVHSSFAMLPTQICEASLLVDHYLFFLIIRRNEFRIEQKQEAQRSDTDNMAITTQMNRDPAFQTFPSPILFLHFI